MSEKEELLQKLREEIKIRGFSACTLKSYEYSVNKYLSWLEASSQKPCFNAVREYSLKLNNMNYDSSTVRQMRAALEFFHKTVLREEIDTKFLPLPKKKKKLPKVLSKTEIEKILNILKNEKHKLIISMLYSTGMRVSELINLKKKDIDIERNLIRINEGKGKKDRYTLLSRSLKKKIFTHLCNSENNTPYLFEGRNGKYTIKSIQKILENAAEKTHIGKKVTPHLLRHSFATHLLEQGTDIRHIQKILGHTRPETTAIYTHVANIELSKIQNPLDTLT